MQNNEQAEQEHHQEGDDDEEGTPVSIPIVFPGVLTSMRDILQVGAAGSAFGFQLAERGVQLGFTGNLR